MMMVTMIATMQWLLTMSRHLTRHLQSLKQAYEAANIHSEGVEAELGES